MAAGWSTVTRENTKFAMLCKLLIDGGTQVLRDIFDAVHPPCDLKKHLMDPSNHAILKTLRTKRALFKDQWDKLYPVGGSTVTVTSQSFDISLLTLLLTNICYLPKPKEDDIIKIRTYRNKLYGHISKPALSNADFNKYWNDIETVLVRLGAKQDDIDHLGIQSLDPEDEKYYTKCLQEWKEGEEKVLEALGKTEKRLMEKVDKHHEETQQDVEGIKNKLDEQHQETQQKLDQVLQTASPSESSRQTLKDVEMYSTRLKKVINQRTEIQSKAVGLPFVQSTKTDDIFTNLTVHHGKQSHLQRSGSAQGDHQLDHATLTDIKQCSDIFVDEKEEKNPKSIIVAGDPGIGKTLFSHKIARDWANDNISIPNIKFTYLLTLRHLKGKKTLSLIELLNLSSLLNETTMTSDAVIDYIVEHPQQLFVILDGMDEYKDRHKITSEFESEFPNDVKAKIPVAALISKLLYKKILRESLTMVTSRVGEANQLDKNIHFDRYVQITGFSESQVLEYVKKYFDSKTEEVKNLALKKVKETEHYMTFGHVPFMCMLMCIVIEWEITNNITSDSSDSLTLTEFYCKVVHCIEKNYNRAVSSLDKKRASSAVTKTLDNFSRLAAQLYKQNKFTFTEEDLKKLKITENELLYIYSSNLLCYIPVASNSPFQKNTYEYSFNHFSLQEFFAARHFVSEKKIPKQKMSEMVLQFMSGLMDPHKNKKLMIKVLKYVGKQVEHKRRRRLVSMRCLYEFKYGGDVLTKVVSKNPHEIYWDSSSSLFSSGGCIELDVITDSDSKALVMFVNKLSSISHTLTNPPHVLYISDSPLSCCSVESVITSLTNKQSTITGLGLGGCKLDDKCIECLCSQLSGTQITWLYLNSNAITDQGVEYMVHHPCFSQLTYLCLRGYLVSDKCKQRTKQFCKVNYPRLELYI